MTNNNFKIVFILIIHVETITSHSLTSELNIQFNIRISQNVFMKIYLANLMFSNGDDYLKII